jgi:hypothetical protein
VSFPGDAADVVSFQKQHREGERRLGDRPKSGYAHPTLGRRTVVLASDPI